MRVALDTNVLIYAEGVNGPAPARAAVDLIRRLPESNTFLPVQVLGELFRVLVKKSGFSALEARSIVFRWHDTFPAIETSPSILLAAIDLSVHRWGFGTL